MPRSKCATTRRCANCRSRSAAAPTHRGVIATCNYAARRFGVRSAMATGQALRRCPQLVVLPPAMEKYRIASRQILAINRDYTELVEPLSLDEAYIDVSAAVHANGSATLMAQEIRERIRATVGITASAGIAPNKFIAKIASDWNKPDGQFVVKPRQVDAFVAALPVAKLFGVGRVTAARLQQMGRHACGDLRAWPERIAGRFGKFGGRLYELCRGIDLRPVLPDRERKSVSVEETYAVDLPDLGWPACGSYRTCSARCRRVSGVPRPSATPTSCSSSSRFADFRKTSAECVASQPDPALYRQLLETAYLRARAAGAPARSACA